MTDQNYVIIFFVGGTLLFMIFAFFIIYSFLIQKRSQYVHKLEKQKMEFDRQNEILRVKIDEQEQAFSAISKELHDNIKSKLGTSQMTLYRISDLGINPKQEVLFNRVDKVISEVIDEVNNISRSLSGHLIKNIGLVEAINEKLQSVKTANGINCNLEVAGDRIALNPEKELNVFRIAQEAIQNCAKYAKATKLSVFLDYRPDIFVMKIMDNGIGFEKNKIHEMRGLGFINMFHRARHLDGILDVQSAPAKGCAITLTLKAIIHEKENKTVI